MKKQKKNSSIKVELLPRSRVNPVRSACFAALFCYLAKFPKWGKLIDWYNKLFKTGHHTTFMHSSSYFTFQIEGISVGDITFGLHLSSPFYNSSQRSGRYCASMFLRFIKPIKNKLKSRVAEMFPNYNPEFEDEAVGISSQEQEKLEQMENYIREFWPDLDKKTLSSVMDYIQNGINLFQENIETATLKATEKTKEERPFVKAEQLVANAPRFAQEQLRNFIPVLTPTGIVYTVNLISLVALWESAWTPPMRYVTDEMKRLVLEKYPDLSSMFDSSNCRRDDWQIVCKNKKKNILKDSPECELLDLDVSKIKKPLPSDRNPVDKLHFKPELMDNAVSSIKSRVTLSVATMGQDQRHRTISRSEPCFTGSFYLTPLMSELRLKDQALQLLAKWKNLSSQVPSSLFMVLAPYGAQVSYIKKGSLLAIDHEQGKRTCWCAQEEIYWLGVRLREEIEAELGAKNFLLGIFEPPCYRTGKCVEGDRYCGRDIRLRKKEDYFPRRGV